MLNYLHEMSREDIVRSFGDTYVAAHIEGLGRRAVRVMDANGHSLTCEVGGRVVQVDYSAVDLEQPDLGMMWSGGKLYYVARNPDRQWRRGLRARAMTVYTLNPDGSSVLKKMQPNMVKAVAKYFIEGNTTNECILSRDFARRGKYLFFRSIPVGTVKDGVVDMGYDIDLSEYIGGELVC